MDLKNHPAADAWPMMEDCGYGELLADIKANGQREPITLCDGMILDGRNRYRACNELGIEPLFRQYDGDPWWFSWSLNGARRHVKDAVVRGLVFLRCVKGSEKWAKRLAQIAEEGNRKRSESAKGMPHAKKGEIRNAEKVAGHDDPRPSSGRHVAREALAAEAKESSSTMKRAEQIAERPDLEKKVVSGEMKASEALRQIRLENKKKKLADAVAKVQSHETSRPVWSLLNVDVIQGLESVRDEHGPARLIFTDPPYNIGIDYGSGKKDDLLAPDKYLDWVGQWLDLCWDCLTDDGSLWVMINDEWAADYHMSIKAVGFEIRSWIKWYETFGVNCSNKFNRTSRHIFYAVKNKNSFIFDPAPVTRPSDRQTKYGDKRAAEGGKIWDDVWQIPRLTGTCNERMPDFPTQIPLAVVEPIVLCASLPGDLVVDPFSGSGTTGAAALKNGRKYVGIEKSEKFVDLSEMRLKTI